MNPGFLVLFPHSHLLHEMSKTSPLRIVFDSLKRRSKGKKKRTRIQSFVRDQEHDFGDKKFGLVLSHMYVIFIRLIKILVIKI